MKATSTMLLSLAAALLTGLCAAHAADVPPKDAKPLSALLKSVEDQDLGTIIEAEFDDGYWEIDVHARDGTITLYLDPHTAKVKRRKTDSARNKELPPQDSRPLSQIVQSLETQRIGIITEIEFDDGYWEVKARKDGKKIKLDIDPRTGRHRAG